LFDLNNFRSILDFVVSDVYHLSMAIKVPADMDFIAQAKRDGTGYADTCKTSKVYPTDAPEGPPDGKVGSGPMYTPRRWASPINVAAKPNIHPHVANKKGPSKGQV
jgi:hypothetical protein